VDQEGCDSLPFDYFSLAMEYGMPGWKLFKSLRLSVLTSQEHNSSLGYTKHIIPKKNGTKRVIYEPQALLKQTQVRLKPIWLDMKVDRDINITYEPYSSSIYRSLKRIENHHTYVILDIKNFFPNISQRYVEDLLLRAGYNKEVAALIAGIYCVTDKGRRFLPQGGPVSPLISNRVASMMVDPIVQEILPAGWLYMRYCDNLILSCPEEPEMNPWTLVTSIMSAVKSAGHFRLHKSGVLTPKNKQKILGLILNESLSPPRRYVDNVRALLHNIATKGWETEHINYRVRTQRDVNLSQFRAVVRGKYQYCINNLTSTHKLQKLTALWRKVS